MSTATDKEMKQVSYLESIAARLEQIERGLAAREAAHREEVAAIRAEYEAAPREARARGTKAGTVRSGAEA